MCTVNLITVGVGNLYDIASSTAAWELRRIASSTGDRTVNTALLQEALTEAGEGDVDVFVDARILYTPAKDMSHHIGLHPTTLERLATHQQFRGLWDEITKDVGRSVKDVLWHGRKEMNIVVYCRSGEMRSVGLARILAHAIDHRQKDQGPPVVLGIVRHLCQSLWKRRTCRGNCQECRDAHLNLPDQVARLIPALGRLGGGSPRGAGTVRTSTRDPRHRSAPPRRQ